jgi:5-oxoprolinase (ATP-hydrolysing)
MSWKIAVDRGGTFTDIVATADDGRLVVRKVPTDPPGGEHSMLLAAVREIAGAPQGDLIPASAVASLHLGTTVATNALLERRGEPVAFLVTRGFSDLLAIGTQERPDLFALQVVKPQPLATRVEEVDERVLHDGTVREPLDVVQLRRVAETLRDEGFRSAAVAFLHGYAFDEHERVAGEVLRAGGFAHVSLSHEVAREIRALPRAETTVADAYLTPVLRHSLEGLRAAFAPDVDVRMLQSHGGLADVRHLVGPRAIFSGPAGGVLACERLLADEGCAEAICFDMGGTSTDVSRWSSAEGPDLVYETRVGGLRLQVPTLRVETVAAGGGSILTFAGRRFRVGPESAGADPGPAGYGRGGPPTITDANAVLGRIVPARLPACFGRDGRSQFDAAASRAAIVPLADQAGLGVEAAALGCIRIANERMAQAIREVSVARGHDVRGAVLVAFGGAGGQHACALARSLGMRAVTVPRLASVFSAWGIGYATTADERAAAVLAPCDQAGIARAREVAGELEQVALDALAAQGVSRERAEIARVIEMRRVGVDATIAVPLGTLDETLQAFHAAHRRLYGFTLENAAVEIVTARVRAAEQRAPRGGGSGRGKVSPLPEPFGTSEVWFEGSSRPEMQPTALYDLAALTPDARYEGDGPALLLDDVTTILVEPGWRFAIGPEAIDLSTPASFDRAGELPQSSASGSSPLAPTGGEGWGEGATISTGNSSPEDLAITTTLFANRFMSIAERMGAVLERTSHSTNIKERLDFSCALFDGEGRLVANAPHIPVHLGAMGETVRAVAAAREHDLREGDVIITNDPYHGGSHLPDVTAVSPVLVRDGRARFFVANRAHHADVGGITPGSMPPGSRTIEDEGACVHDLLLVRDDHLDEEAVRRAFTQVRYPARALEQRMSDFRAQAAANAEGGRLLRELCAAHGEEVVTAYMGHVLDDGAAAMGELIAELPPGPYVMEDLLDDGTPLRVTIWTEEGRVIVDFAGTGPRSDGNLNAPRAVTRAAVLYALRTLVRREIPLNEGCLRPVEIRIPPGSLLDPTPPHAVVGGNVETSMRLVDLVLGALGACAASQGTMNNITFGTGDLAFYETVGGGAGAGPDFDGASAVHLHMTNTRITDVEVIERRYPVVIRLFAIRRGSGGAGRHRGGDGIIREIEFLMPVEGGILSEHRARGPFGLSGGGPGTPGVNALVHDGVETRMPGRATFTAGPGDVLRVETPGGGGYGALEDVPRGPWLGLGNQRSSA